MWAVGRTAPSSALSWGIRRVTPPASPGHSTAAPRTASASGPACAASSPTRTCSGIIPFPVWYNSFYPECQFIWEYVFRVGATDVQSGFHKCWAAYQTYSPWSLKAESVWRILKKDKDGSTWWWRHTQYLLRGVEGKCIYLLTHYTRNQEHSISSF